MSAATADSCTAFIGHRHLASGPLPTIALAVKRAMKGAAAGTVLIFDDATGRQIDIDIRGSDKALLARLASRGANERVRTDDPAQTNAAVEETRSRGRPKLGVVAREVTLLPRHWEWLATQPGGASVALRKLVEEARRTHAEADRRRQAQEAAYHFVAAIAGNMPGFEEALRALFANDQQRFRARMAAWPDDVRDHAIKLAFGTEHGAPASTR